MSREKIELVRVIFHNKVPYGMYAEDWYVKGYDAENNYHEGWESDFFIKNENHPTMKNLKN